MSLPPISAVMPKRDAGAPPPPPPTRADGEACEVNDDCRSEFCLLAGTRSVCTRLCRSNGDCVSGFTCRRAGNESVCMPFEGSARDAGADDDGRSAKAETGGCSVGGNAVSGLSPLLLLALLGMRWRRR